MLNYLGPNTGPSTVGGQLPSGVPGTVPAAIPGVTPVGAVGSVTPTAAVIPSRPAIPNGPLPPALANAIQTGAPSGPPLPPGEPSPSDNKYEAHTQSDGSVVLFLRKADGTRGPAVLILPASKFNKVGRPAGE